MDAIKPGSGVGFGAPILESGGPAGAGGGSGAGGASKFADVLNGGGGGAGPGAAAGPGEARTPFTSPILDTDMGMRAADVNAKRRVTSLDTELKAGGHRRPSLQATGERAGRPPGAGPVEANREPVSFRQVANDTAKAESKIDAMIDAARRGKNFSPSELLGLQMEVYRYQQTVDVISKTAEKVVGGIKQTLGTQV